MKIKNESRGFHLNNLSYAGPIVMGVGGNISIVLYKVKTTSLFLFATLLGFIVVAACVMTFEARDSAAKVVPARFKLNTNGPGPLPACGRASYAGHSTHGSLRTSGSQTGVTPLQHPHCPRGQPDRRAITQSFMQFSRGLAFDTQAQRNLLKVSQVRFVLKTILDSECFL